MAGGLGAGTGKPSFVDLLWFWLLLTLIFFCGQKSFGKICSGFSFLIVDVTMSLDHCVSSWGGNFVKHFGLFQWTWRWVASGVQRWSIWRSVETDQMWQNALEAAPVSVWNWKSQSFLFSMWLKMEWTCKKSELPLSGGVLLHLQKKISQGVLEVWCFSNLLGAPLETPTNQPWGLSELCGENGWNRRPSVDQLLG